jgi:hypothetical protein
VTIAEGRWAFLLAVRYNESYILRKELALLVGKQEGVMFWMDRKRLLLGVSLVVLIVSSTTARPRKLQRLQKGIWGGPHIRISVGPGSATIDYDCANGTIAEPLTPDSRGHFTWRGTHNREHGGPIRMDEQSNGRPAIYSGWIKGDTMNLTVKLVDTNEVIETYILKHGSPGRILKCK